MLLGGQMKKKKSCLYANALYYIILQASNYKVTTQHKKILDSLNCSKYGLFYELKGNKYTVTISTKLKPGNNYMHCYPFPLEGAGSPLIAHQQLWANKTLHAVFFLNVSNTHTAWLSVFFVSE